MNNQVAESAIPATEDKRTEEGHTSPLAEPAQSPIELALKKLLKGMEDLREAAKIAAPAVHNWQKEEIAKQRKQIDKYISESSDGGPKTAVAKGAHAASDLTKSATELRRLRESNAVKVLMRSLYIGIFSEYDVFIGDLLEAIYELKPDLFKGIKREITLSELLEFASVDAVKQDILDKEIDSFRRNSYVEQFIELESKFDVKTLRTFEEWPTFVELGQRRNLLTHNGGICSEQYLSMCEKVGFKFEEKPNCGDDLMPTGKYFYNALFVVAKVAFMLTHTLWRKLLPEEVSKADESMNTTIYEVLSKEWWRHGAEFGKFGLSEPMMRKSTDIDKRIRVINTAIGLKNFGKIEEVKKTLQSMDWTASIRDFQLAIFVLSDDYKSASELMRNIGKKGEMVEQLAYHTWPLFFKFRDSPEFQKAYEDIYGMPFIEGATKGAQADVIEGDNLISDAKKNIEDIAPVIGAPAKPADEANKEIILKPSRRKKAKDAEVDSPKKGDTSVK